MSVSLEERAERLDQNDPLKQCCDLFEMQPGLIYLDGNSLGPMLKSVPERISKTLTTDWAQGLIRSWNDAGWIDLPRQVASKIAPIIGADPACVTVTDSTSVNLFKLLSSALVLNQDRRKIVSEKGNFPTDLYLAEGVRDFLARDHELVLIENDDEILSSLDEDTAVLMLTHIDFRTGRMLDMEAITKAAHEIGVLVIWDLAHSAGAVPVSLDVCNADFAVGCGYKYLNGGPGAPSFIYVNRRHLGKAKQPLTGWFSHKSPFAFDHAYSADQSINQFLCGTPPILSMVALDEALSIWGEIEVENVREKSLSLSNLFIEAVTVLGLERTFPVATPLEHAQRGSQVSLCFNGNGYAVMQALISRGVIGDFRDPDILRFGFAPLYNSHMEVFRAVSILKDIMESGEWEKPEFTERKAVT